MIIHGSQLPEENGRKPYRVPPGSTAGWDDPGWHFVIRITRPENPFAPHKHEGSEMWFILEGDAQLSLDGTEYPVTIGDLIVLKPWTEHGLRTESEVRWICMG